MSGASVFVRNLPFGITQEELEQVFGEIGPVKKVDVIKNKGAKKSEGLTRGFAFVRLYVSGHASCIALDSTVDLSLCLCVSLCSAMPADAAAAVEKLNRTELQGRKMLIGKASMTKCE